MSSVKFIFVKISSVYVSNNLTIYNTTRKTSALITCWAGGKRRQEKSSCTHIKQRWCCSLWTKTKNLVRKLFFIKSCSNIWFIHVNPLELFRHQGSLLPKIVLTFHCLNKFFWRSQKFCKLSAFNLEFQKFFSIARFFLSHSRSEQFK